MKYYFGVYKTIIAYGINFFFSKKAYEKMIKEEKKPESEIDWETLLMYCNTFEVV